MESMIFIYSLLGLNKLFKKLILLGWDDVGNAQ